MVFNVLAENERVTRSFKKRLPKTQSGEKSNNAQCFYRGVGNQKKISCTIISEASRSIPPIVRISRSLLFSRLSTYINKVGMNSNTEIESAVRKSADTSLAQPSAPTVIDLDDDLDSGSLFICPWKKYLFDLQDVSDNHSQRSNDSSSPSSSVVDIPADVHPFRSPNGLVDEDRAVPDYLPEAPLTPKRNLEEIPRQTNQFYIRSLLDDFCIPKEDEL